MSLWSRLTSGIAGFGVGAATADTVTPVLEPLKQTAWRNHPAKTLTPSEAAFAEVRGLNNPAPNLDSAVNFADDAAREGIGPARYGVLKALAQTYPGLGELDKIQNRKLLADDSQITLALKRQGYSDTFVAALIKLFQDILSVSEIANAVQQGHLPNEGADGRAILPGLPTPMHIPPSYPGVTSPDGDGPLDVPLTQINSIDPTAEAQGDGYSFDRLQVLANLAGLPPGPQELLTMLNRNLVSEDAVDAGLREGHLKTKWADAFKRLRWNVLSHIQYVDARVRGWIDNEEMYRGGALHGFLPEQMDMLHRTHGRPLSWHQVWIGLQRGGQILDPVADITAQSTGIDPVFFKSLQQSDIQQQWYDLAWAQRYTYPSAFVLRQLATSGSIDGPTLAETLKFIGWEPTFIEKIVTAWTGTTTTATQKKQTLAHLTAEYLSGAMNAAALTTALVGLGYSQQQAQDEIALAEFNASKAVRTKATTAIGKRFIALQLTEAEARNDMAALGWPAGAVEKFVAGWNAERDDEGTTLTQKQVLTAYKKSTITAADALARLEVLGSSAADAQILLDSQ